MQASRLYVLEPFEGAPRIFEARAEDVGVDLPTLHTIVIPARKEATIELFDQIVSNFEWLVLPRSSFSKTPLVLDVPPRNGNQLHGVTVRNESDKDFVVERGTALFQLVDTRFHHITVFWRPLSAYKSCVPTYDVYMKRQSASAVQPNAGAMQPNTSMVQPDAGVVQATHYVDPCGRAQHRLTVTLPRPLTVQPGERTKVSTGCSVVLVDSETNKPVPYGMFIMNSVEPTLTLSNVIGIIDSGYRGMLIAAVHNTTDKPITVPLGAPFIELKVSLEYMPFVVREIKTIINPADDTLGLFAENATERGAGGFGSTGAQGSAGGARGGAQGSAQGST